MSDYKSKYGQYALITGASSGIGEAFAYKLASLNLNLVLIARREERLKKIKEEIELKYSVNVVSLSLDLTKENFIEEVKEKTENLEIGILINNAGFGSTGDYTDIDADHEEKMIKLNCLAPYILTHHFVKQMKERRKGAIIFLGSVVSLISVPYMSTYSATKAFNTILADGLWYELKKYNIDVLSLNPGGTETEFQRLSKVSGGPFVRKPEDVVKTALKALGKKAAVVDGLMNKLNIFLSRLLPRKFVLNISGKVSQEILKAGSYENKR
ncbi:MAG: SDR family oxidoreductase [Ignavibacteria bacterium]|jgi:short-subunit dehydrogenase